MTTVEEDRLSRDLVRAASTLSEKEARFLVDSYYIMQDDRKRAHNQVRSMASEPHLTLDWLARRSEDLEAQIKRALDSYSDAHPVGVWAKSIYGIGPVISAGLLAHIDITRAPTAGHIWRFAGLDPTSRWLKGQKRPWNAQLKTLCWKIGQSFMKFSNAEECFYGQLYRGRKLLETERNDLGQNAPAAAQALAEKNYSKETEAYKAYASGKLPPAQVDARARRYAVKMFLSHYHLVAYWCHFGTMPPKPFVIEHGGHVHFIRPPEADKVAGLMEALRSQG